MRAAAGVKFETGVVVGGLVVVGASVVVVEGTVVVGAVVVVTGPVEEQ
jgi:acyl-[acyl carrier protein]--UDP-N-acetylglucosamine O-acyltransferase